MPAPCSLLPASSASLRASAATALSELSALSTFARPSPLGRGGSALSDGAVGSVSVASPIDALPCREFADQESLTAFPCNWDAAGCRVQGGTTRSIHVWIFSCRARSSSRSLRRCLADSAVLRGVAATDCPWKWCDSGACDMRWVCAASSAIIENGFTTCGRKSQVVTLETPFEHGTPDSPGPSSRTVFTTHV